MAALLTFAVAFLVAFSNADFCCQMHTASGQEQFIGAQRENGGSCGVRAEVSRFFFWGCSRHRTSFLADTKDMRTPLGADRKRPCGEQSALLSGERGARA